MRVLYVEDNPGDARLLHHEFAERAPSIEIDWVPTYKDAVERLSRFGAENFGYDLILTDMELPDGQGISLLSSLRDRGLPIPLVVITGLGDEESAVNALKAGASDYVVKRDDYLSHLPGALGMALTRYRTERARHAIPLRVLYGESDVRDIEFARRHIALHAPYFSLDVVGSALEVLERSPRKEREESGCPYDILLLDCQLPGMTVIELLKELRGVRRLDVPIVVISGENNQELAVQALRLGADDYIAKNAGYLYQLPNVLENTYYRIQIDRERATLKASEEYFRTLIENASDLILVLGPDGSVRYCSPSVRRILGYDPEEFISGNPARHIDPDNRREIVERLGAIVATPGATSEPVVLRVRHKNGSWRYLEGIGKAAVGSAGQPVIVVNARDISERMEVEGALQESETKYRGLVENSLVGVFIVQDGAFRFVNTRFCEIHGFSYEELVGRTDFYSLIHPDDRDATRAAIENSAPAKDPAEYEYRVVRKDGRFVNVKTFVNAVLYGGRHARAGTMIDITREKTLEGQLRQALKMEAIGTLAGGIAHDFNNILTVLTGYGTLLKMETEKGGPARAAYVDAILDASLKAANLTQSLLAFARQQPITLIPADINEIVRGTEKLLKRLLTEDIALRTSFSAEEILVLADKGQMDQILINLAANARDSMPMGGTLTVETTAVDLDQFFAEINGLSGSGRYALLSVTDTGVGMDEATKEHIFEPFFTTKAVGKGTGMGLATVYGIVKQHNGCIVVYSEKGVGTAFHIYLPVTRKKGEGEELVPPPAGGTETILLAEDDEEVRGLMRMVLTGRGYSVIEAVDGEDAVELFKSHSEKIALLIIDSVMPRMNGRQAYDAISGIYSAVKVIFTSGYTRDVVLDKGIEDKKFDFLTKPVSPDILLRKVREVLDRGKRGET
jgi:PAS domain S-box-containing protein